MEKIDGLSMHMEQAERDKLAAVFPQCFVEGRLDIDKLLNLCGEYIIPESEKYEFRWQGKHESLRLAQQRSTATLRPCPEESVDFDTTQNLYIEGDNLEVLKLLQTPYYRKVKMIYIDPPYNTGNDFVYEDDFRDTLARYKEVTSQTTKSNPESMGRFHTNWLNMMYPRLRLAASLLRDDGVIFISIDHNETHNLRKLCDEVFGEENYIQEIIWEKKYSPQNDAKYFSLNHEQVLCYAKQRDTFQRNLLPMTEDQKARYKNPDNDPRGPWKASDLTRPEHRERDFYPIKTPSGKEVTPAAGRSWSRPLDEIKRLQEDNRLWFGEKGDNIPSLKRFLSEMNQGMVPISIWSYDDVGHTQLAAQELKKLFDNKKVFDFPKPVDLIKRCIIISTNPDDIVLDFFAGSAPTAQAVMQLNKEDGGHRHFILVQLPEICEEGTEAFQAGYKNICEIGKDRIRRAGAQLASEEQMKVKKLSSQFSLMDTVTTSEPSDESHTLDTGFKVFKLDSSNLKNWDGTPVSGDQHVLVARINSMVDRVKPERSDLDMIYEIMLKIGVPLTYNVTPVDIGGKTAYRVREDCLLLICLENGITAEMVEKMAEYAPAKIILAESGLADDTAMSNAHYILRDRGIELKLV